MNFNSINPFKSSFIALPSSQGFLSDEELNQILDQPNANAENNYLGFGPPPKLPLWPQFSRIESLETKETKKRKKEDEVLPTEVSIEPTTKKGKPEPTKLTYRNMESMSDSDQLIVDAIVDVIVRGDTRRNASKKCRRSEPTTATYVDRTLELLGPSTGNNITSDPRCRKIIDAAVAQCQTYINEDPLIKAKVEQKRAEYVLKVNKREKKKPAPTKLSDRNIEPMNDSDNHLINAIVSVIIYDNPRASASKECGRSLSNIKIYVNKTLESLDPSTENKKKSHHRYQKIVDAAVAQCQTAISEDPSLKAEIEGKIAKYVSRVNKREKKKPAPTNLGDRNINPEENVEKPLIDAIVDVVIRGQKPICVAKQYKIPNSTLSYYIENTTELLKPTTQNGKKNNHTRAAIVDAAVAKCLKLLKEDPSLIMSEEKKRERNALRVDALLQAMKHNNPDDVTDDKLEQVEWGRKSFERYVRAALSYAESNTFPTGCNSFVKEAAIKYRESSESFE